jgi:hypothetical protein
MPELKNTFTGARMEKDLDERIVPSGSYRDALNIEVSTSEDSDVGAAQNILGNIKVTEAINGDTGGYSCQHGIYLTGGRPQGRYYGTNFHIASVIDPQSDMLYRFVATVPRLILDFELDPPIQSPEQDKFNHGVWMDRIVEYDTTKSLETPWHEKEKSVLVDIYKVETTIESFIEPALACNKTEITLCYNTYQLREGMIIKADGVKLPEGVYIETITWSGIVATIMLSENIDSYAGAIATGGNKVSFHADRVLNFHPERLITGINIVDGMIFWTDNYSEPKKVHIERGKLGSKSDLYGTGYQFDPSGSIVDSPISYGCGYNFNPPGGATSACFSDFDQHTKLIVKGAVALECDKDTRTCDIGGCLDGTGINNPYNTGPATNYNPNANIDDGSCLYIPPTNGCMDPLACNYLAAANNPVVPCTYPNNYPCEKCDWGVPGVDQNPGDGLGIVASIENEYGIDHDPLNEIIGTWCNGDYECIPPGFDNDTCFDDGTSNIQDSNNTLATIYHWDFDSVWREEMYKHQWNGQIKNWHFWIYQNSSTYVEWSTCSPGTGHVGDYAQLINHQTCIDSPSIPGDHRFKSRIVKIELWEVDTENGFHPLGTQGAWGNGETNFWDGFQGDFSPAYLIHAGGSGTTKIRTWNTLPGDTDCGGLPCTPQKILSSIKTDFRWDGNADPLYNVAGADLGDVTASTGGPLNNGLTFVEIQNTLLQGLSGTGYTTGSPLWPCLGGNCPGGYSIGSVSNTTASPEKAIHLFLNVVTEPCTCVDANPIDCTNANSVTSLAHWAQNFTPDAICIPQSGGSFTHAAKGDGLADCLLSSCHENSPVQWNSNLRDLPDLSLPSPLKKGVSNNTSHEPQIVVNPIRGLGDQTYWDFVCRPIFIEEKHVTVVRKGPTAPPKIQMYNWDDDADIADPLNLITNPTGSNITQDDKIILETTFAGQHMPRSTNYDGYDLNDNPGGVRFIPDNSNTCTTIIPAPNNRGKGKDGSNVSIFYDSVKNLLNPGDNIILPIDVLNVAGGQGFIDWKSGDKLRITHSYTDSGGNTITPICRVQIIDPIFTYDHGADGYMDINCAPMSYTHSTDVGPYNVPGGIECVIIQISEDFPTKAKWNDVYNVRKEQKPPLFETKFPKFSYRYKYEDGEYSVFAPWSEIAFMPGKFDYLPKKGYNLGMVNHMRSLNILDWNPKNRPKDVVEIDLLYKESNSPNVYTVKTFKITDPEWSVFGTGDNQGVISIQSELIHKTVPSNQMLRPWDNVPRKALGQEVTANRLIFANYLQNYDMFDENGVETKPKFSTLVSTNVSDFDNLEIREPLKSMKSMRNYQVGIVYRDRYGRETPVLTDDSGSVEINKKDSKYQNRLEVQIGSTPPAWAESYTFYIKETSNEYYNLAMDRWYNADDDGVWISFPSSERNKVSESSMLLLKKQHDSDIPVDSEVKYKVLDIKNSAPSFIKTEYRFWGSLPMMLPPPGWGTDGKAGNQDTGMFHLTGLPLPNRLYIDIYAEYFNQSVLADLMKQTSAQIRLVQSDLSGSSSSYNASASDSINKSKWYDIANISYIGSPPETFEEETQDPSGAIITQEVEVLGQAEQIVRITLEQIMGDDLSFCEPFDNLSLARGLAIEARTSIIRDRAQFQGRFFVKILRDSEIQANIILGGKPAGDNWQVLANRDIKYVAMAHPGVQEWMTGATGTLGAGKGKWYNNEAEDGDNGHNYNYIPTGKKWSPGNQLNPAMDFKAEVSSYHEFAGDASYRNKSNTLKVPPIGSNSWWPMGPGYRSNYVFSFGWWYQKYFDLLDASMAQSYYDCWKNSTVLGTGASALMNCDTPQHQTHLSIWPDISTAQHNWPSFGPSKWGPGSCRDCTVLDADFFSGGDGEGLIDLSNALIAGAVPVFGDGNNGANPMNVPAIWGDQNHLLGYTLVSGVKTANTAVNANWAMVGGVRTYPSEFKSDTIEKLRSGFYYLWHGQDKVDKKWPLGRFEPNRWFIDKCGAADGYSGAGIWEVNVGSGIIVSRMDLSFYGIGSLNEHQRSHDLSAHQDNAVAFGELIGTVGTQFRFKQDPNQTVYTVTEARLSGDDGSRNIYNYECHHGSWGYEDPDNLGAYIGGGGMGSGKPPPWGGKTVGSNTLASKALFFSDLFNEGIEMTGGAPYNYRQRITITLDKVIGSEGINFGSANTGFHPIKNHVDADGNCNIKGGVKRYSSLGPGSNGNWMAAANTFPEAMGGIPTRKQFFNLSSYWNYTGAITDSAVANGQDDLQNDTAYSNGQHFGLHERGLNSTTIEIITPYKGDDADQLMSKNPAIFETEPMEDVGLDIYHAASPTYPINLNRIRSDENKPDTTDVDPYGNLTDAHYFNYNWRGEEVVPVGATIRLDASTVLPINASATTGANVIGVQGNTIWTDGPVVLDPGTAPINQLKVGYKVIFEWDGEGNYYGAKSDKQFVEAFILDSEYFNLFRIQPDGHGLRRSLGYYNCYSFSNGVESNRVRDDYNAVTIDKGVKASMPLAEGYEEERKASSLIFSGIYNSTSGVNRLNQFIQAEPITKEINPINGSIQKLFARDTDLVTFCENKVFKILANKDALFNASGNTNLTATNKVLGQTVPFVGDYGISKNPESLANESYRLYFSDKSRGAILRLSRDGLTPISDKGMKNWFKDNLFSASKIVGSYDDRQNHYNLTLETADNDGVTKAYTLSYVEEKRGWESFKSWVHEDGISHKNNYYTFANNNYQIRQDLDPWGITYSDGINLAEMWQHHVDTRLNRVITPPQSNPNSTSYIDINRIWVTNGMNIIKPGMNIEGDGIPADTYIKKVACGTTNPPCMLTLSNKVYMDVGTEVKITTSRNSFYNATTGWVNSGGSAFWEMKTAIPHYSMLRTMFNREQGNVKRFKTLNYEGSQAKVIPPLGSAIINNNYQLHDWQGNSPNLNLTIIRDNFDKEGWYVEKLKTDLQTGSVKEFVDKENKWFDYIRGKGDAGIGDFLDTGDFSLQGLGVAKKAMIVDSNNALICVLPCVGDNIGCTDFSNGWNPDVDGNDKNGNPCYYPCQDNDGVATGYLATNYDPNASTDDGSCAYQPTFRVVYPAVEELGGSGIYCGSCGDEMVVRIVNQAYLNQLPQTLTTQVPIDIEIEYTVQGILYQESFTIPYSLPNLQGLYTNTTEWNNAISSLETQTNTTIAIYGAGSSGYIYFGEPDYPITGAGISLTTVGITNLTKCDEIKDDHGNAWRVVEVEENNLYAGGGNARVGEESGSGITSTSGVTQPPTHNWSIANVILPPNATS